jgi:hypothetical protein
MPGRSAGHGRGDDDPEERDVPTASGTGGVGTGSFELAERAQDPADRTHRFQEDP